MPSKEKAKLAPPLTAESARQLFSYDPVEGVLRWKVRRKGIQVGWVAGHMNDRGYVMVIVNHKTHMAHRVIWLMMTGAWPLQTIDHINNRPEDNRFENLRAASQTQNHGNRRMRRDASCGYKGVIFDKRRGKYVARICINYKTRHLGQFDTAEDAHAAYVAAAQELFGSFARAA